MIRDSDAVMLRFLAGFERIRSKINIFKLNRIHQAQYKHIIYIVLLVRTMRTCRLLGQHKSEQILGRSAGLSTRRSWTSFYRHRHRWRKYYRRYEEKSAWNVRTHVPPLNCDIIFLLESGARSLFYDCNGNWLLYLHCTRWRL